jgi:hypothetical protein
MVDWSVLGLSKKGLAVEGKTDKLAIEAFLDAGEIGGHWSTWRSKISVEIAGDSSQVIKELGKNPRIWGLIDRDWLTEPEVKALEAEYPQLFVLPRVTIENYCIDPKDLSSLLPANQLARLPNLHADIEAHRADWIQNGALWQALHENGAHEFCRGHEDGYPMALLHKLVVVEADIEAQLKKWHSQLDPSSIMPAYQSTLKKYRANSAQNYSNHIHGKNFFKQVIVSKILNPSIEQRADFDWLKDLFAGVKDCPSDLTLVLQRLVG